MSVGPVFEVRDSIRLERKSARYRSRDQILIVHRLASCIGMVLSHQFSQAVNETSGIEIHNGPTGKLQEALISVGPASRQLLVGV